MNKTQRGVLLYFLGAHWKAYLLITFLSLLLATVEALHVSLLYPILHSLLDLPRDGMGGLGQFLDGLIGAMPLRDSLAAGCLLLVVLTPLKGALQILHEYLVAWASGRVLYSTKKNMLERYAQAPYQYFLDHPIGELMHCALTSPTRASLILSRLPQVLGELLRVTAVLALLFSINAKATVGLLVLGLVAHVLTSQIARRVSYYLGKGRVESGAAQNSIFNEFITGIKHISVFNAKTWWLDRFDDASRRYNEMFVKDAALVATPKAIIEAIAITGVFGTLLAIKLKAPEALFAALPAAGTFCMALVKMMPSLGAVSRAHLEIMGSLPDIEAIHRSLLTELRRPRPDGKRIFSSLERGIDFRGVHLDYPDRPAVLQDVEMSFPARQTTAIAGDSGSGKTSVINLLLGLFDPTGGEILIDGRRHSDLSRDSWLSKIAVVSQDPFVFNGTVRDNIVFGREGFTRDEIEDAAKTAHAHEFIGQLPQGYATVLGERGMKLSGGQQQRIAIARAVLGDPQIMIFDEATSALDSASEAAVQQAIRDASAGKTVVVVAHRLSTIEKADRIYVLRGGRVIEHGTHAQLLAHGGRYAEFHAKQTTSDI